MAPRGALPCACAEKGDIVGSFVTDKAVRYITHDKDWKVTRQVEKIKQALLSKVLEEVSRNVTGDSSLPVISEDRFEALFLSLTELLALD